MSHSQSQSRRGPSGELIVPARLFCDATPGLPTDGELVIGAQTVEFEAGDAITELPVAGLVARVGGYEDRTLFLSHPSQPGVEIATADPAARMAPAVASLPSLAASLKSLRASRRRFWGCVAAGALVGLLAVAIAILGFGLGIGWLREVLAGG